MATTVQLSDAKKRLLAKVLKAAPARHAALPLEPRVPGAPIPLAPCQNQIWLHAQLAGNLPLYNEPITLHFRGRLQRAVLERAMQEILRRHEAWRTTFAGVDGRVVQRVHDDCSLEIPCVDLSGLPEERRHGEAIRLGTAETRRLMDLSQGPLLRVLWVKFSEDYHRLYFTFHHLIFDGVTHYRTFMPELRQLYSAFSQGLPSPLPEPRLQYADYALWETRLLETEEAARQMDYWRHRLAGEPPNLQMPTDRPRPPTPSFRGAQEFFAFNGATTEALKRAGAAQGVTLYMFLLAAFKVLLYRYTGQEDILVGGVTDARRLPEFEPLIGFFLNTLVFRSQPTAHKSFQDYLVEVKDAVVGALSASDIPFDRVLRELHPKRDVSRHPLFQALFSMEPPACDFGAEWDLTQMDISTGTAKFDLYLEIDERPEGLIARFIYSTDLFDASTIRRLIAHWRMVLDGAMRSPGARLCELPLLTPEEVQSLVAAHQQAAMPIPAAAIHQQFEAQAARTPDALAVLEGASGHSLTYQELNEQADQLARSLQESGAGRDTLIGVCVERTCDLVVAVLAILKAGAAYLPLDPALPPDRLKFILQDSRAELVLSDESEAARNLAKVWSGAGMQELRCANGVAAGDGPAAQATPQNLAYVLYTSGSTGLPKGVEVEHRAVVNFLESMRREPGFTPADTMLAVTNLSFDIAGLEIYLPLTTGGRVVIAGREETRDPRRLMDLMAKVSPTVMQATPGVWRALLDAGWRGDPQLKILCGGEALTRDLALQLLPRCAELWNMYGPTETTIWSAVHKVTADHDTGPVPVGHAIANTSIYVLDSRQALVPAGVIGELWIGGAGLARGYRHRPELTEQKFVSVAAAQAARLYRTGDLARRRSDDLLECLGREDNQVKIRGFRVELEEIESALAQHPEISAAAVKAWPDNSGALSLVAYVVSEGRPHVRTFLRSRLPEYMVPSRIIRLGELPMTSNGKLDRKALPPPTEETSPEPKPGEGGATPVTEMQQQLVAIWESVLGRQGVGIHDNFFDLGGHSLLVAKLLGRIERDFRVRIAMGTLFLAPTVEQFSFLLQNPAAGAAAGIARWTTRGSDVPLLWLDEAVFRRIATHVEDAKFVGVPLESDEAAALPAHATLEQIAACVVKAIRQIQPQGPYALGGWCNSGILAFETARQLVLQGCEVKSVVLIDSVNPAVYRSLGALRRFLSKLLFHFKQLISLRKGAFSKYAGERVEWVSERFNNVSERLSRGGDFASSFEARLQNAVMNYEPETYAGHVVVLYPKQLPGYRNPWKNWSARVADLEAHSVRGHHEGMLQEPGLADLAVKIGARIEEINSRGRSIGDSAGSGESGGVRKSRLIIGQPLPDQAAKEKEPEFSAASSPSAVNSFRD